MNLFINLIFCRNILNYVCIFLFDAYLSKWIVVSVTIWTWLLLVCIGVDGVVSATTTFVICMPTHLELMFRFSFLFFFTLNGFFFCKSSMFSCWWQNGNAMWIRVCQFLLYHFILTENCCETNFQK